MPPPVPPTPEAPPSRRPRNRAVKHPSRVLMGMETLRAIDRYQKLTAPQIARLIFSPLKRSESASLKATYEHPLHHLKANGLIEARPFNYRHDDGHDTQTKTFHLTGQGVRFLNDVWTEAGIKAKPRSTDDTGNLAGGVFPEHWLKVKDALIAFEAAGKIHDLKLRGWADDDMIRRQLKPKGYYRAAAEPDGYLWLANERHELCVLVEVDRGTEDLSSDAPSSWRNKTGRYLQLLDRWETDPFFADGPQPLVVIFAGTAKRADSIRRTIEAHGGRDDFWVSTFAPLSAPSTLFDHGFLATGRDAPTTITDVLARQTASKSPSKY